MKMAREELKTLELKIGYTFKNQDLLHEAMTHGSVRFANADQPHHERLEFLGDAVLYTVISDYIFKQYPLANPGEMTLHRKGLITDAKQNEIANELNICEYVQHSLYTGHTYNRWGEFIEALIGAVYVDAGMGAGMGLQKAKEVIFKLYKLKEPEVTHNQCAIM